MEPICDRELLHLLEDPAILEELLKKLKLQDLKSCRLVCKLWCQSSLPAMKQSGLVVRICESTARRKMSDFLELIRVEGDVFEAPSFMEHFQISWLDGVSRTFWEACGRNIKSLYLKEFEFESVEMFRFAIFQSCPKLESLSLINAHVDGHAPVEPGVWVPPAFPPNHNLKSLTYDSWEGGRICSWMEILSQFPSLERFNGNESDHWPGFFDSLALARRQIPEWWKLKELHFRFDELPNPLVVLPVLEDRDLPLETLEVKGIRGPEDVDPLRRILTVHAPTLKDLSLSGSGEVVVRSVFPLQNNAMLENVERLSLESAILHSPCFLRSFPNLKKLELAFVEGTPEIPQGPDWIHSTCTDLVIYMRGFKPEILRHLLVKVPNLEKLKAEDCNNEQFQVVCELLPNLERLEICSGLVDDMGISGLDEEHVERINEEREDGVWRPITVARANLTSLTKLKFFSWKDPRHQARDLDYTSVLCILKLPQLKRVRIKGRSPGLKLFWDRLVRGRKSAKCPVGHI